MSYCTNCGAPLKDGAKFCPNCGHQVMADRPQSQSQSNESVWNASAASGEVVMATWENPNPQPTQQAQPQPQIQYQQTAGSYQPKTYATPSKPVQQQPQKKSHGCLWAILIVLAIVVGFFVYAFYIM